MQIIVMTSKLILDFIVPRVVLLGHMTYKLITVDCYTLDQWKARAFSPSAFWSHWLLVAIQSSMLSAMYNLEGGIQRKGGE